MIAKDRAVLIAKEAGGGNSTGLFQLRPSLIGIACLLAFPILVGCSAHTETVYVPVDKQASQREWLQAERKVRLEGRLSDSTGLETYAPAKLEPKTGSKKEEE